jgi:hypothetical protein
VDQEKVMETLLLFVFITVFTVVGGILVWLALTAKRTYEELRTRHSAVIKPTRRLKHAVR